MKRAQPLHKEDEEGPLHEDEKQPPQHKRASVLDVAKANTAIATNGYYIVPHFFPAPNKESIKHLQQRVAKSAFCIFNAIDATGDTVHGDEKRKQAFVDDISDPYSFEVLLANALEHRMSALLEYKRVPTDMVYLLSERGCGDQPAHSDWDPNAFRDAPPTDDGLFGGFPVGAIIAIQDKTYFNVWPGYLSSTIGSDEDPFAFQHECVCLDAGDLLLFRADLVHSGAAFQTTNVRIHVFLDVPNLKRMNDATYPMIAAPPRHK